MKITTCKGCGEKIAYIKTSSGKSMPCNINEVIYWERKGAAGKVVTPNGEVLSCDFEGEPAKATGFGYVSHFATCPKAGMFRR